MLGKNKKKCFLNKKLLFLCEEEEYFNRESWSVTGGSAGLQLHFTLCSVRTPLNHSFAILCYSFNFFRDIDGVLKSANGTEYGLASGVFTRDIGKALYVTDKLDAGTVFVNTYNKTDVAAPFGGFKQSGFGKDLGEFRQIL